MTDIDTEEIRTFIEQIYKFLIRYFVVRQANMNQRWIRSSIHPNNFIVIQVQFFKLRRKIFYHHDIVVWEIQDFQILKLFHRSINFKYLFMF